MKISVKIILAAMIMFAAAGCSKEKMTEGTVKVVFDNDESSKRIFIYSACSLDYPIYERSLWKEVEFMLNPGNYLIYSDYSGKNAAFQVRAFKTTTITHTTGGVKPQVTLPD